MTTNNIKTYSELISFKSFEERFKYLKLNGVIGEDTFGLERYLNQVFYKSREWKKTRDKIILRDNGCDLGIEGHEIYNNILIHHINPISIQDIRNRNRNLFDPENLITTRYVTHNAIHYGSEKSIVEISPVERFANDTKLW